jgi:hypothetical protein
MDVRTGQVLGWFELGLPLTAGGTHQQGSDIVYFPADSLFVFAFDVRKHECMGVLMSGHPSGSLRTAPLIVGSGNPNAKEPGSIGLPSSLLLCQADGPHAMKLRVFPLPLDKRGRLVVPAADDVSLPGWAWFEPFYDGEKIALASDTGVFGLFGTNQPGNQDPPLFRLLPQDPSFVSAADAKHPAKAQVVYALENDFWILIGGRLRRLQLTIDRQHGLEITRRWEHSTALGRPLHAGQVDPSGEHLVVVTQPGRQQTALVTAVVSRTGQVRWQRRLGFFGRGDSVVIGAHVIMTDAEGGVFSFDPAGNGNGGKEWQASGTEIVPPVPGEDPAGSYLLPAPDGKAVYAISAHAKGRELQVRRYEPGHDPVTRKFGLPFPLSGTPGVGSDYLVLPLAGGSLMWAGLDGQWRLIGSWSRRSLPNVRGHVVHLSEGVFLTTDGDRSLTLWRFDGNMAKEEKTVSLPDPIVGVPLLLSAGELCLADLTGTIRLLRRDDLQQIREWPITGQVTAGPYRLDHHIGCVVDGRRLVWIDPKRDGSQQFTTTGQGIVGRPQRVGDVILVADLSGRLVALDPATGETRGTGYTIRANVPPVAAPIAFGESDRIFVPLADGTIVLIPLSRLQAPPTQ